MPGIAQGGLAVAEDDRVVLAALGAERNRLRQAVGEAEMLAGHAVLVELEVERELMDDPDVVRRQRRFDGLGPGVDGGRILVVEQQQRMHGQRRDHLARRRALVRARQGTIVLHGRVAAPARPAVDDGALPLVPDPVAEAAQPVLLVHALAERRRKARQRVAAQARFLQARPGEGERCGARVLAVAVGDRRNRGESRQPGALARDGGGARSVLRPVAHQEQRLRRRQIGKSADDDALRQRVVRRLQLPARRLPGRRAGRLAGGLTGHRSSAHAAASCSLNCLFPQAVGDAGIALDLVDREITVGAVPEAAHRHRVTGPRLELPAVARAVEHEEAGRRKADAAAPGERQSAMRLLDEVVEVAFPAMIEVAEEHQAAAIVHEGPVGEMDRAHAAEIAVRRDDPEHQAEAQMPGAEQRHAQDAGFDEDDAAHVVLRNPVLAARHLAQQALVDRRRIMRGIAPFEPAQPQDDCRTGEGEAQQAEQDGPGGRPQHLVEIEAGDRRDEQRAQHRGDDKVKRQDAGHRGDQDHFVRGGHPGDRESARARRHALAGQRRPHAPQLEHHQAAQRARSE